MFRYDWKYLSWTVGNAEASFLEPDFEDQNEDWGARGALLERYRALVATMKKCGMEPRFPFPLASLPGAPNRLW
ncbi:hypothetical protein [Variovorax sp. UC122_21]|uniref:hypothetical protein n=1 Tax=Variovorax sp. UC122_21 TaxID=3374554 RepID=UPI003757B026